MRAHLPLLACLGGALAFAGPGSSAAQQAAATPDATVFYKCTDAKGQVSVQNGTPCAAGMRQEIRRIGEVRTVPVPAAKSKAAPASAPPVRGDFVLVAGPTMQRTPAAAAATLPPPPTLFECSTWEGTRYLGETATPAPRCAPLQVVGIDGSAALGMGQACEMKQDACTEVPEAQRCAAWYRRMDEAEFRLRYASDSDRGERQAALTALDATLKASNCSPVAPTTDATP